MRERNRGYTTICLYGVPYDDYYNCIERMKEILEIEREMGHHIVFNEKKKEIRELIINLETIITNDKNKRDCSVYILNFNDIVKELNTIYGSLNTLDIVKVQAYNLYKNYIRPNPDVTKRIKEEYRLLIDSWNAKTP